MNGMDFLAEKIGKKQLISIVGMIIISQMSTEIWQVICVCVVCLAGIASQLVIDWFKKPGQPEPPAEPKLNKPIPVEPPRNGSEFQQAG